MNNTNQQEQKNISLITAAFLQNDKTNSKRQLQLRIKNQLVYKENMLIHNESNLISIRSIESATADGLSAFDAESPQRKNNYPHSMLRISNGRKLFINRCYASATVENPSSTDATRQQRNKTFHQPMLSVSNRRKPFGKRCYKPVTEESLYLY